MQTEHSPFPTDETLAAYIDGRLDEETRKRVVEHMAECPECFDVAMGGREAERAAEEPIARVVTWPRKAVISLAAAAVVAMAVFLTPIRERIWPRDDIRALAAVAPPKRLNDGRITGFRYSERAPRLRGDEGDVTKNPDYFAFWPIALRVYQAANENRNAETLHAKGVAQLVIGADKEAVQVLEDALRDDTHTPDIHKALSVSSNAQLLSDLAAAYIALGDKEDDPQMYLSALDAADHAWELAHTPEIAWNRALAAEQMHMRDAAARWREYLNLDSSSQWAPEAQKRLNRLESPTTLDKWNAVKREITETVASGKPLGRLVTGYAQQARAWCDEELLPQWASAHLRGDDAGAQRALSVVRAVGEVLVDRMTALAVARIDSLRRSGDGAALRTCAEGHVVFARGYQRKNHQEIAQAIEDLTAAQQQLSLAGSSYAANATLFLASCHFYRSEYRDVLTLANRALSAGCTGCVVLRSYGNWVRGLTLDTTGYPYEALADYRSAIEGFTSAQELSNVASVKTLLAGALSPLGRKTEAWRERRDAMRLLAEAGNLDAAHSILIEAAATALDEEHAPAARAITTALVEIDLRRGGPAQRCAAFAIASMAGADARYIAEATRNLADAQQACAQISDARVRSRSESNVALAAAHLADVIEPSKVAKLLADSTEYFRISGNDFNRVLHLTFHATVAADGGSVEAARRDAEEAGVLLRRELTNTPSGPQRHLQRAAMRKLLEREVALLLRFGRNDAALDLLEFARTTLATSKQISNFGRGAIEAICQQPGSAGVSLFIAGDAIVAHVVTAKGIEVRATACNRADLIRDLALSRASSAPTRSAALARIYDVTIRPLEPLLQGIDSLVIAPDDELRSVPFPALYDTASQSYLVERWTLRIVPAFAFAMRRGQPMAKGAALVIGDPAFSTLAFPSFERLSAARDEARQVAAVLGTRPLTGAEATRAIFVQRAPLSPIIHFAGHFAATDPSDPDIAAMLMASPGGDDCGAVYSHDVRGLDLRRVDLVVLSACGTASSRDAGVAPLADSFLAAGARSVIGTMRPIADDSGARFMRRFYEVLRTDADVARALRAAQVLSIRSARGGGPEDAWMAYELIG